MEHVGVIWRPVRSRFGITAFGANVYTADKPGQTVIEEHAESGGHEELYTVIRGRASFVVDGEEIDGVPGTLVFVRPGTTRTAVALERDTAVLAVGAKPGERFEPSAWEDVFRSYSLASRGELERAREVTLHALSVSPTRWQTHYNAACMEARWGDVEAALEHLSRAAELDAAEVKKFAPQDTDLDRLRADPRYVALVA